MYLSTALKSNKATVRKIHVGQFKNSPVQDGQLPDALYEFTALEHLELHNSTIRSISPKIGQFKLLKTLSIHCNGLTELPEELGSLPSLYHLALQGGGWHMLPASLVQLPNLESLELKNTGLEALPHFLGDLPKLRFITLMGNRRLKDFTGLRACTQLRQLDIWSMPLQPTIWASIRPLSALQRLTCRYTELETLPSTITQLQQLNTLDLNTNQLSVLPDFLQDLTALSDIRFAENQLQAFPTFLKNMPQLRRIEWLDNPFGNLDKALLDFDFEVINPYTTKALKAPFRQLLTKVKACIWTALQLHLFFALRKNTDWPPTASRADFLALAQFDDKSFQRLIPEKLLQHEQALHAPTPLTTGSELVIIGRPNFKKTAIKKALKEQGIAYQNQIGPNTTHLLIGTGIKDWSQLANTAHTLLSPQVFQTYMNTWTKPYLLEDATSTQHLSMLLTSQETDQQALGIELLKGGGVPKELLTELFIVYKFCANKSVASRAKKMLINVASPQLLENIKLRISLSSLDFYYTANDKLQKLVKGTALETWKIVQFAYAYHPQVWKKSLHLGIHGAPRDRALAFLNMAIETNSGYNQGYFALTAELLPWMDLLIDAFPSAVRHLELHQLHSGVPTACYQLEHLEALFFNYCSDLQIDENIKALQQLEEVHFEFDPPTYFNNPTALFAHLAVCPKLRTLILRVARCKAIYTALAQLDQLEILENTHCMETTPEELVLWLAHFPRLQQFSTCFNGTLPLFTAAYPNIYLVDLGS